MPNFFERYRHLSLLAAVLFAQLFFLAFQIKTQNNARLIRVWAAATLSPVQRGLHWTVNGMGSLLEDYILLTNVQQENHTLRAELEQATIRIQQLEARASEAGRLTALLNLKQVYRTAPLVAAEVIGASPASSVHTVLINRGTDAGFEPNMAVLTPAGVVGKIVTVHPTTAEVLLITDQKSGVGAVLADSRILGVLKGTGETVCQLAYVPGEETVLVDARLLTSGQDQVFPKGLPLGIVTAVEPPGEGEFFQQIEVRLAAQLNRLEQVLVLVGPPESLNVARAPEPAEQPLPR